MKTSTLIRLAVVNVTGFSASTIMPLWLGGIARQFGMEAGFASAAVLAQLGGAALLNLLTPWLFRRIAPARLARAALLVAAAAYLLAVTQSPARFLLACLICGGALGTVLSVTNRLMGSAEHVQRGYAVFVLIEVCLATLLFLAGAALIGRFGLLAVFPSVSAMALVAWALLTGISVEPSGSALGISAGDREHRTAAILCLAAFALFFIGQAALNSFMPAIGQAGGLSIERARRAIGLGMPGGFVGAILARAVGERVPPLGPVVGVAVLLAAVALLLRRPPAFALFEAGVILLAALTIFVVPYFFAQLGALDRSGRYAACGPAMMLTGIAIGPGSAVMINSRFGLAGVGFFSAALLVTGGLFFAIAARRRP